VFASPRRAPCGSHERWSPACRAGRSAAVRCRRPARPRLGRRRRPGPERPAHLVVSARTPPRRGALLRAGTNDEVVAPVGERAGEQEPKASARPGDDRDGLLGHLQLSTSRERTALGPVSAGHARVTAFQQDAQPFRKQRMRPSRGTRRRSGVRLGRGVIGLVGQFALVGWRLRRSDGCRPTVDGRR
jgi:hypothetical protein